MPGTGLWKRKKIGREAVHDKIENDGGDALETAIEYGGGGDGLVTIAGDLRTKRGLGAKGGRRTIAMR